jgi:hypothetical protein
VIEERRGRIRESGAKFYKVQLLSPGKQNLYDCNLYSSPNIISVIKSMKIKVAGHVGLMGEKINANRILVRNKGEETTWNTLV